jgi:hypothetical protein
MRLSRSCSPGRRFPGVHSRRADREFPSVKSAGEA